MFHTIEYVVSQSEGCVLIPTSQPDIAVHITYYNFAIYRGPSNFYRVAWILHSGEPIGPEKIGSTYKPISGDKNHLDTLSLGRLNVYQ